MFVYVLLVQLRARSFVPTGGSRCTCSAVYGSTAKLGRSLFLVTHTDEMLECFL